MARPWWAGTGRGRGQGWGLGRGRGEGGPASRARGSARTGLARAGQVSALPQGRGREAGPSAPAASSGSADPARTPAAAPRAYPGVMVHVEAAALRTPGAACELGTGGGTRRGAAGTMPFLPEARAAGRAVALTLVLLLPAVPAGASALLRLQPSM